MAKIPFHIKYKSQIESGEYKVVNSYGEPVRIICWDARIDFPNGIRPIISLQLIDQKYEVVSSHFENGKIYSFKDAPADLFIVTPEEEPTEFEKFMDKVVDDAIRETYSKDGFYDICRDALALAEKEIAKGHEHDVYIPEDTYYEQLKKQWEEGYDKRKVEALKDLPRWEPNQVSYSEEPVLCNGNTILNLGWVHIHIDQLKKLPGFKEDEQ